MVCRGAVFTQAGMWAARLAILPLCTHLITDKHEDNLNERNFVDGKTICSVMGALMVVYSGLHNIVTYFSLLLIAYET